MYNDHLIPDAQAYFMFIIHVKFTPGYRFVIPSRVCVCVCVCVRAHARVISHKAQVCYLMVQLMVRTGTPCW